MEKEYIYFNLPTEVSAEGEPQLVGYAAVYEQLSEDLGGYRAKIKRGAFDAALASGKDILALLDHDESKPLASTARGTLQITSDDRGLLVRITPPATSYAADTIELVRRGLKRGMSIGFPVASAETEWTREGDTKVRNHISIGELTEVSIVTTPAFAQTSIASTFSLIDAKKLEDKNKKQYNTTNERKNTMVKVSWSDIKKLEEQKAAIYANAQALMATENRTEDENKQLDSLCETVDRMEAEIEAAKKSYFGKPTMTKNTISSTAPLAHAGFSRKDLRQYSLLRAINLRMNNKPLDGIEAEVNEALIKYTGKAPQGFFFPNELTQYDLDTAAGDGAINESVLTGSFVELLRSKTLVDKLGATTLTGLVGNVYIPKQSAATAAYWVAESNSPTESNPTITQIPLSPKTVGAYTDISRKMILQTSLSCEAFVRNDLATTLALAIDRAAFEGTGTNNQPAGVIKHLTPVISTSNYYREMVEMESTIEAANALDGRLAYVMRPATKAALKTSETFTGSGVGVWDGQEVNGYPAYTSTNISLVATDYGDREPVVFGDWSSLVIGYWGALDVLVDPYTASTSGTVRVRALQDVDIALRHENKFALLAI